MADTSVVHNVQPRAPLASRMYYGLTMNTLQTLLGGLFRVRDLYQWFYPADVQPNFIKVYDCRPTLPIRIFFPKSYDQTSPQTLPTLFVAHGGGFCVGIPEDDDVVNERFANMHNLLVIELNYRKAPAHPFPTPINDVEALMLAVYADESIPIDKSRIALVGFSAGGNIMLAASQLPSIREQIKPAAIVPIYASLDMSIYTEDKVATRHFKPQLKTGIRAQMTDYLAAMASYFVWSYIPYGQELRDPLLSPYYAPREQLPRHIFLVAAELDMLGSESWRMANRLAGRPVPSIRDKTGRETPSSSGEPLILDDERFAFEQVDADGEGSVRWLLVPDEVHGFDHIPTSWHKTEDAIQSARWRTIAYQKVVGEWLHSTAWK